MNKVRNNYAYIDGANLHKGITSLGWTLDYHRFRIWLAEKYNVGLAYLFIGLIPRYKDLYTSLQKAGFTLVFKEVVYDNNGKPKGNCDADLVLYVVRDVYESEIGNAVIVASDGDYAGLIKFLQEKQKIKSILSPASEKKCSLLLKRTGVGISYLDDQKNILMAQKEKAPDGDRTP
ncbi:MAG: NYN domain-containing protein [Patescibacteria group bacterium]